MTILTTASTKAETTEMVLKEVNEVEEGISGQGHSLLERLLTVSSNGKWKWKIGSY